MTIIGRTASFASANVAAWTLKQDRMQQSKKGAHFWPPDFHLRVYWSVSTAEKPCLGAPATAYTSPANDANDTEQLHLHPSGEQIVYAVSLNDPCNNLLFCSAHAAIFFVSQTK
jgi:hypothetical protein